MKDKIKAMLGNVRKFGLVAVPMSLALSVGAFAAEGDPVAGPTTAMGVISAQADSLKGDAITIIAAALGIGAIFFGAKFLWSKFKSMSK